mmetsp:Transcript_17494/g.29056  ORF Transcript_17494/g.29056 Transcript_17494/m.29056 type:complete len:371 (-) Transcript_17494:185-1297(-)
MVAGLAFLSKKSFNPKNLSNQKTVWEARQQQKQEEKRLQERQTQLKREQEDEELARSRYGDRGGEKASLGFMYAPPPGMAEDGSRKGEDVDAASHEKLKAAHVGNDLIQRQDGDDDATAAFRAMLAGVSQEQQQGDDPNGEHLQFSNSRGAALQGTTVERGFAAHDGRSALEKAVGRRDGNSALTLEEQVARFPQLKHAPMAKGMSATDVQVNFKPLGTQLRNVQCLACGIWGHSRGDRECDKSGWDPFAAKPAASSSSIMGRGPALQIRHQQPDDEKATNPRVDTSDKQQDNRKRRDDYSESDSSSDDSSYERRRRRHKKKKRKRRKEKKRQRRERSRSPGDDDDYHRKKNYDKEDSREHKKKIRNDSI